MAYDKADLDRRMHGALEALKSDLAGLRTGLPAGTTLKLANGSTLKVVGEARSISQTAQGWMTPQGALALGQTGWQMLYRYADADTEAAMTAHKNALGPGVQTQTWLTVRNDAAHRTQLFVPLLSAFGLIGLALSALVFGAC